MNFHVGHLKKQQENASNHTVSTSDILGFQSHPKPYSIDRIQQKNHAQIGSILKKMLHIIDAHRYVFEHDPGTRMVFNRRSRIHCILLQFRQLMLLAYVLIFGYVRGQKTRRSEERMGGE